MTKVNETLVVLALSILMISSACYGLDTDLYVLSGVDIPPNVLVILDTSASLDEVSTGQTYDPSIDYSLYFPSTVYPRNAVYYKATGNTWTLWRNDYTAISCLELRDLLSQFGEAINYNVDLSTSGCGGNRKYSFQMGNFRNYLQLAGGPGGNQPRFGLAKAIIGSYLNTTSGVRFGVMGFNRDTGDNSVKYNANQEYVFGDSRDDSLDANGGRLLGFMDENNVGKTALLSTMVGLTNDNWSPLAETLYEAGVYFQGGRSAITGASYTSPVQYYCQKNYVLIISDGTSTKDSHDILSSLIGDRDSDGKVEVDDVAKYLYDLDLSGGRNLKKQNITTYTIGFSLTQPLLEETAQKGGGRYFYVWSSQSFNIAFQTFISEVLEKSLSYVAPVVPISQMERTSAGNRMYLAMFKPTFKSFWKGNLKKYGIATEDIGSLKTGDILDATGALAVNSENQMKETARSYWSTAADGGDVEKGGVGELLLKRTTVRNLYTYFGTNTNLTDSANAFQLSNMAIIPLQLGLVASDNPGRDKIINFIHGFDAYDENGNGNLTEKRDWVLGAFIHSRPLVIHYGETRSVIYAGANDGILHAFDDATGEELWGFIPPTLLPRLKNLTGEALQFFVDGSPKAYIGPDNRIILIFGLRRGGDRYYALDITDPLGPKFLWEISPSTSGYQELGQTWSTPQLGKIQYGNEEKWVLFIGGGYDTNQDNLPVVANDTRGRAIYVVDILTGTPIWSYSNANNAEMKYCIPSDVGRVDTDGDGKIDRLYVGDTGGRVWRFDVGDPTPANWTAKILFNSNPGASDHRKIFYPPDVTLENDDGYYEIVCFGTGDREHPKDSSVINRLYAVKDKNPSTVLTETDLVDVTQDLLQDPNTTEVQKSAILSTLKEKKGWYIKLDQNTGEKCLSNPVVFYGVVYYSTFTPTAGSEADICFVGEGTSRLYALGYTTGAAVFNLDATNDTSGTVLARGDRSVAIGSAIPSGVIITIIRGTMVAYVGVGGGVYRPGLPGAKSLIPITWRIVF
jgi:type IV pilus assembly protein PilY1